MITIEVRGIPCVWNDEAFNDMKTLEMIWKMDSGNASVLIPFAWRVFGVEQYENILTQLADDSGVCSIDDFQNFVMECMNAAAEAKKIEPKN